MIEPILKGKQKAPEERQRSQASQVLTDLERRRLAEWMMASDSHLRQLSDSVRQSDSLSDSSDSSDSQGSACQASLSQGHRFESQNEHRQRENGLKASRRDKQARPEEYDRAGGAFCLRMGGVLYFLCFI